MPYSGPTLNELKEILVTDYLRSYKFSKDKRFNAGAYLLYGGDGIGKTAIVYQIAEEIAEILGLKFVDLSKIDEDEIRKIANEEPGKYFLLVYLYGPEIQFEVQYLSRPYWGKHFLRHPGILFIDDITYIKNEEAISILTTMIKKE